VSLTSYQRLIELVGGDDELIGRLVEEGLIERHGDRATVDLDRVLLVRTLWRDLDVDWPGIEIVLRLLDRLTEAQAKIAELEARTRR
jgi:hypothetical protein